MLPKNKKFVYLVSFTVLGLLVGLLFEALFELLYIRLLLTDFQRYSFGVKWSALIVLRDLFAILVILTAGRLGYSAGKYWWHQIYELKKYPRRHWFKF